MLFMLLMMLMSLRDLFKREYNFRRTKRGLYEHIKNFNDKPYIDKQVLEMAHVIKGIKPHFKGFVGRF